MKRSLLVFAVLMLVSMLSLSMANASDIERPGRFGLGLALGYPGLGLSTNTFVADWMSIKAELYPFYGFNDAVLDADYLFWLHDIAKAPALDFTWFAGPGLALVYWGGHDDYHHDGHDGRDGHDHYDNQDSSMAAVIKGAIGLALQFNAQPFDLVFEFSPGFVVGDSNNDLWITAMIASRYYF